MSSEDFNCAVIGAGAVGLAVARALARRGLSVLVLEQETHFGSATSSRNSEVIHAGLYYPEGSLKARLCTAGKAMLYRFCADYGVQHLQCGKLVVAASEGEISELEAIAGLGQANGVDDLKIIDLAEARRLEPELSCAAALLSPSTGIVDSHGYMLALLGDAEAHGAVLARNTEVTGLDVQADGVELLIGPERERMLKVRAVVNAAGLRAVGLARNTAGLDAAHIPEFHLAKGVYFTLAARSPFRRLIYPVPDHGGLGIHLTLDLAGQARFGPDVEWVERIDYAVDPRRAERFYPAIRRYWPGLREGALSPAYAGVRPKLSGPGAPGADFRIEGEGMHGAKGLVNLFGIESPGLTASLAIAEEVAQRVEESFSG